MSTNSFLNSKPRNFKLTKINDFTVHVTDYRKGHVTHAGLDKPGDLWGIPVLVDGKLTSLYLFSGSLG